MIHRICHWWHSRNLGPFELCPCWKEVGYYSNVQDVQEAYFEGVVRAIMCRFCKSTDLVEGTDITVDWTTTTLMCRDCMTVLGTSHVKKEPLSLKEQHDQLHP